MIPSSRGHFRPFDKLKSLYLHSYKIYGDQSLQDFYLLYGASMHRVTSELTWDPCWVGLSHLI